MTTIDQFNRLNHAVATTLISRCCGSARWAERMVVSRPYRSLDHLIATADEHWRALRQRDFLEAFRDHPQIGHADWDSPGDARADTRRMAAQEQCGVAEADARTRESLAAYNREYVEKFGFIFIVCASGKSAGEMLELMRARLANSRNVEIANAAEEQLKITRLRIHKLFAPCGSSSGGGNGNTVAG